MRILVSLFLLGSSFVFSPHAQAETLTWDQCVTEASHNNAAIKAAYQSWRSSLDQIDVARANYYPQVSASLSASYGHNYAVPGSHNEDSYAANLQVSQNIFNGWADKARVDQNSATASIAEYQLTIAKAQTSYDLKTAYVNLIYAQRAIRLQESIRDRRKANLGLVELRFDNGNENKGSVLLSQSYLNQAEFNIIQAKNNIQNANAQLARALGRDDVEVLQVAEDIPSVTIPTAPDYHTLALATPQRKQAVLRETVADKGITLAKAGYFPTLGVQGTYGRQDDVFFPQDSSWSVGLVLSVPIFNGGRDYFSTQSAIESRSSAGSTREDLDKTLVTNLTAALTRLIEAKQNVDVNLSFLKAAEMRAEIGRGRYNNGLLSFDDWDLIENDLINRQAMMIQSQRDYVLAEAAWENALGTGSIK